MFQLVPNLCEIVAGDPGHKEREKVCVCVKRKEREKKRERE